ncbi:hypothetical protein [Cryptosporangium minutisporangium]|uniref:hypothetical protein n=1 Tax=Cryptosporangium minutisporangium TaxID=113569 RepID=UPI0031EBC3EA
MQVGHDAPPTSGDSAARPDDTASDPATTQAIPLTTPTDGTRARRAAAPSDGARPRLQAGQLTELALAHMRAHPNLAFTAYELGRVLDRSPGSIRRLLERENARGTVTRDPGHSARYRIAFHLGSMTR